MSESVMTIDEENTRHWKNEAGDLHRIDGPAVEWTDGTKQWYQNGQLHRLDGPSIEWSDGIKQWHQNGLFHRLDGPAVEYPNGSVTWYIDGYYLGFDLKGFWALWELLDETQRQNINIHMWLARLTHV